MSKKDLDKAKRNKNDEFYTSYEVIERELVYYTHHFNNKIIYLNTDNPKFSQFWKYFKNNFENFKIKKLISTYYVNEDNSYKTELVYINNKLRETKIKLKENGDFRSSECIEILKECDVIITNPPFSLFREFIEVLETYNKKYLILGTILASAYSNIFPLFFNKKLWLGADYSSKKYIIPDNYNHLKEIKLDNNEKTTTLGNTCWYTNLTHEKQNKRIFVFKKNFNENDYQYFDNYNAIYIDKVQNIPDNFWGYMGVPITFLNKINYDQFEIIDATLIRKNSLKKENLLIADAVKGINKHIRMVIKRII